jgi:hypothetical protein
LRLELVVIGVDLEFMDIEVASGVDQDWKWEIKKASVHPAIL